ncbi:MAG: hypothetical protein QM790_04105 [Nibricoccus sp.]
MKALRNFYIIGPSLLVIGWATNYYFWRSNGGGEDLRPLFDTSKQWYIGRDGKADAENDIRRHKMKLFGGWSARGFGPYELSSYQKVLREYYSIEPISLFEGDAAPDKYVVPYCNAYNAVIFAHLKSTFGPDVAKKIKAEYQRDAELQVRAAQVLENESSADAAGESP